MRAAWFERFGPAADVLQVGERETPVAGPGEVLVRLATSGVNPFFTILGSKYPFIEVFCHFFATFFATKT